ncbi:DNA-packaging protein [Sphingomonas sp. ac-8]|uniref:DNA-packaging protein n=1 Tax=Sphingomonas sp. ac-8 TaxID=3242977 RepID=UPI003A80A44E
MRALARADPAIQAATLAALSPAQRRELLERWERWAHAGQLPSAQDWRIWLILAGRGFGKTRAAAEWVSDYARRYPEARIALVGATLDDVHRVMIGGEGGLRACAREQEPTVLKGDVLHFASGARGFAYSAEAGEKLRGPEHHAGWCDEIAKWRDGDAAWDNLTMGLRLGERPQLVVTTTPRPVALLRRVRALPGVHETVGRTRDNPHLPASFVEAVTANYAGTRLGRQELDGELIEDVAGALWTRAEIERCRVRGAPALVRVVVAVDPPASAEGDACGIVAAGLGSDGRGYVLEDASAGGLTPDGWARAVAGCAARHGADRVVAEANQGGAMVETVLRTAEAALPVRLVHASRGKVARAEPVAALYEQGRVGHVGAFPELEDQLCGLVAGGGYAGPGRSPDRADALVWALAELMLGRRGPASVRCL